MTTPIATINQRLTRELDGWSAVEYRIVNDYRRESPTSDVNLFQSYREQIHYIETGLGQRLLVSELAPNRPEQGSTSIDYFDGKKAASLFRPVQPKPGQGEQLVLKRIFGDEGGGSNNRPFPFRNLYVGLKPLNTLMDQAQPRGGARVLDRDCERFLVLSSRNQKTGLVHLYDLDVETSMPLRVTCFELGGAEPPERPVFTWTARAFERIEGHPVATRAELLTWGGPPASRVLESRVSSTVAEVYFDRTYPMMLFRPTITDQTKVFDTFKRTISVPKGQEVKPAAATATATGPIRAEEEGGWAVPGAVGLSVLGVVLVVIALILRRRS